MRILVCSDIHANPEALESVLVTAEGSWDGFVCLGDIAGYGPDPDPCVALLQSIQTKTAFCHILAGNHDAALTGKLSDAWFNANARQALVHTRLVISPRSLEWLSLLPSSVKISDTVLAVHGSPAEPVTGYLLGGNETRAALEFLEAAALSLCLCGHTHETSIYTGGWNKKTLHPPPGTEMALKARVTVVNPGSVGFPRAFNGGRTADMGGNSEPISVSRFPSYFALWDTEAKTVTFRESRYDRRPLESRLARAAAT